jgi:peptide deformylase
MQLDILRLGHPTLREVARPLLIEEVHSEQVQQVIEDMVETMHAVSGAGLAAPQVGQSVRLCVAEVRENPRYPGMPALPLRIWINPVITLLTQTKKVAMYEGCLSVPGLRGQVVRPATIRVESMDRDGLPQVDEFDGPLAAVAQHECDHLDGKLFVDHADPATLTFIEEYQQFVAPEARVQILENSHP